MGSFPYPRNGILKLDYEFILIFKKHGNSPKPTQQQKELSKLSKEEWKEYFSSHWYFNGIKQTGHIAMFPEELPKRLIKMYSYVDETVFDPFAGSGTTLLASKNSGRNSIGYEINKEFEPLIREKIGTNNLFSSGDSIEFIDDIDKKEFTFDSLPYIFNDPHKLDKKTDIKKLNFGSKIDKEVLDKKGLFSVKEVIAPDKIKLSNGETVNLLGVIENKKYTEQAVSFLKDKFSKRKIFVKYDENKYDKDNNLTGYVYLDNKTFINNHLIRTGFVNVDTETEYSCKEKSLKSMPL